MFWISITPVSLRRAIFKPTVEGRKRVTSLFNTSALAAPSAANAESPLQAHIDPLLCIVLNDARGTDLCLAWILSGIAQASALPQQVPALIQFDLDFRELLAVCAGRCPSRS
jgi:hypothetical protein